MIANEEQITEHIDSVALLAVSQQLCDRDAERLPHQIEKGRFDGRQHMNRRPLVEGLLAAAAGVQRAEALLNRLEDVVHFANALPYHQLDASLERAANRFAARRFAHACVPSVILEHHQISNEHGPMPAAEIQQKTVVPGDRHNGHPGDGGQRIHCQFELARYALANLA
jgi:hypothetical protein